MGRTEALTSPANPLLKDVRRAISRGGLTEQGYVVAETFHLLEEALRSDLDIKVILAAESVQATVQSHVRGLSGIRLAVVADNVVARRLYASLGFTEYGIEMHSLKVEGRYLDEVLMVKFLP